MNVLTIKNITLKKNYFSFSMTRGSKYQNTVTHEFLEDLEFVADFLQKHSTLTESQRIMLRTKARSIQTYYNDLVLSPQITSQYVFRVLMRAIPVFDRIGNYLAPYNTTIMYWEYYSIYLLSLVQLTSLLGESMETQLVAIAQTLVAILGGIEVKSPMEFLVDETHHEYLIRYAVVFNVLNNQFLLFSNLLSKLYDIHYQDYLTWSKYVIQASADLLSLLESQWDVKKLYYLRKKHHVKRPFFFFTFHIGFPFELAQALLLIAALNKGQWPQDLKENPFGIQSTKNLIQFITYLLELGTRKYNELETAIHQHFFNMNDQPNEDPDIQAIREYVHEYSQIIQGSLLIHQHLASNDSQYLERLQALTTTFLNTLTKKKPGLQEIGEDETLESELNYFIIRGYLAIIGYTAFQTMNPRLFDSFVEITQVFYHEASLKKYPGLGGIKALVTLTLAIQHKDITKYEHELEFLSMLFQYYQFKPRDLISYKILYHVSQYILQNESRDECMTNINAITNDLVETPFIGLQEEMRDYLTAIQTACNGQEPEYSLKRLSFKNAFDPATLFIPDISLLPSFISKTQELPTFMYIPFNYFSDAIHV